jgi:hypothetical protein
LAGGLVLVGAIALARVALYLVAAPNYGYFRDELYYLACGEHPAWGYMDQPPLIGWMAWLLEHTIGVSLYAIRLLPMLANVATMAMAALLSYKLGGRRWAMGVAALAVLVNPISLCFSHLFTMNAFDPLLWVVLAWLIVELIETGRQSLWLWIGALVGVTLLNKYGVLFLLVGLLAGVVASPLRRSVVRPWFWAGAGIATAIALPNFLWQMHWHFPFVQLVDSVRKGGRDVMLPPIAYLGQQAQMIGFVPALLVLVGVWFLFSKGGRRYSTLGWGFLSVLGIMLAMKGKFYYTAPAYPIIFAAGAVGLERATAGRGWKWIRPLYIVAMLIAGAVIAPTMIPVLPVESYIAYTRKSGIEQQQFEHQPKGELPQLYADMFGWEDRVKAVADYYHSLPAEEQRVTAIGAPNYGEAGAIDHWGAKYGLPKAISTANNYWIWGPREFTGQSLILMDEDSPAKYRSHCRTLTEFPHATDGYSRPDEEFANYHCRGLTPGLQELWPGTKPWR